jgi:RimJ/RimL family protein N-acetyltransferase
MGFPSDISLEGPRLVFRWPEDARDDEGFRTVFSDLKTMKYLPHLAYAEQGGWTLDQVRERRELQTVGRQEQKILNFHIFIKGDLDTMVGLCGFREVNLEEGWAEFGILVHHPYWGRAYCTEAHLVVLSYAFEKMGLSYVQWGTNEENVAMRQFLDKFGASRAESKFSNGAEWLMYRLTKEQWPHSKAKMEESLAPALLRH